MNDADKLIGLQKQLVELFDLSDLEVLCFRLNVRYDNLSGTTLDAKTRSLVEHTRKNNTLNSLVDECNLIRPNASWSQFIISPSLKQFCSTCGHEANGNFCSNCGAKLDASSAGFYDAEMVNQIRELVSRGKKIDAIALYRRKTKAGVKEAREFVERFE